MNCRETSYLLDDFIDAALTAGQRSALIAHVESCDSCMRMLESAQELQRSLRELPAPRPRDGFFDQALAKAAAGHRHRYWHRTLGGALAAGLGLVFVFNLWLMSPAGEPDNSDAGIPSIHIALQETRNIKLLFVADHALQDARLTLLLPANIELSGYDGQRRLSWTTQLKKGNNLLVLPVTAHRAGAGTLTAELEQQGKKEIFRIDMESSDRLQQSFNTGEPLLTV